MTLPYQLLLGLIEKVFHRLYQGADWSEFAGKRFALEIHELKHAIVLVFTRDKVLFSGDVKDADCLIRTQLSALRELKDKSRLMELIKQERLVLEGDLELAQQLAQILSPQALDLEEKLSQLVGDPVAYRMTNLGTSVKSHLQAWFARGEEDMKDFAWDEWKITPHPLEVEAFSQQVQDQAQHLDALEQRINRLLNKAQ